MSPDGRALAYVDDVAEENPLAPDEVAERLTARLGFDELTDHFIVCSEPLENRPDLVFAGPAPPPRACDTSDPTALQGESREWSFLLATTHVER